MSRDIGIRNLLPGVRSVNEIKEDEKAKKDIQNLLEQRTQNTPELNPLDNTLASYIPTTSLDLSSKPIEKTKDTKGFNSQRDYENYLTSRARLKEEAKEARELRQAINTNKIVDQVDKLVNKYDGPSTEKTIGQLKALKKWAQPNPTSNEGKYIPWQERMAQEEAEALNEVKRTAWEQGGKVKPEPKYVSAQDVKNVYQPKQPVANPLQMKKLHQRLQNHNERTGQFKNLPKEEEIE